MTKSYTSIPKKKPDLQLLDSINEPEDIRSLSVEQLLQLADELRYYLLYSVGKSGGHFGANLGVVELTIALHYVYQTPHDTLLWDVGHQSYPHKILTGRKDKLVTIRQKDGLAPFPDRNESKYDFFGTGHSSTSISSALAAALAARLDDSQRKVVAVIGDGALTAGMAFEALNHAGAEQPNLLIILNDNDMSISHNVGALSNNFTRFFSSHLYASAKSTIKQTLRPMPQLLNLVKQLETHGKGMMIPPSMLFEAFNCHYLGPVDGHDLKALVNIIDNAKKLAGVQVLHVRTTKGRGFLPAEQDPVGYHALSKIEPLHIPKKKELTCSNIFSTWICDTAQQDARVLAITPAMREGSDLVAFSKKFAQRYFDVGIAEQHALTLAAGFACAGYKPVVAIYSTFLQRGYDQLIHDICLQNLDVTFAIDRAGLVGEDGPTHNGIFDVSYCRCLPNMIVMAPASAQEMRAMLSVAYQHRGPASVRYPRGSFSGNDSSELQPVDIGKACVLHKGKKQNPALLAFGTLVYPALGIAKKLDCTLVNMRFIKPLDQQLLQQICTVHSRLVSLEENTIHGGCGSAISEWLHQQQYSNKLHIIGIADVFVSHGSRASQLQAVGLDSDQLEKAIRNIANV